MRVEGRKFNSNFVKKYGHLTEVDYLASFLLVFDTRSRIARVRDDVPQFPDAFQVLQNAVREDKVCGHTDNKKVRISEENYLDAGFLLSSKAFPVVRVPAAPRIH